MLVARPLPPGCWGSTCPRATAWRTGVRPARSKNTTRCAARPTTTTDSPCPPITASSGSGSASRRSPASPGCRRGSRGRCRQCRRAACAPARPSAAGLEPHRHHAVAGALDPPVPVRGVGDVVPDAPGRRCRGRVGQRRRQPGVGHLFGHQLQIGEQRLLPNFGQTRKANADKANRADLDRVEQQPTGMAISVASSVVAYGSVADRVRMLMSDFFSLTVTVRAPRPSFSSREWACSPMRATASRS